MDASWIARELEVPRGTIVRWLRRDGRGRVLEPPRALAERPCAYLLGLRIACDSAYPGIIEAAAAAMAAILPGASVLRRHHPHYRCTHVVCVSRSFSDGRTTSGGSSART
jgi:hypothetical protein